MSSQLTKKSVARNYAFLAIMLGSMILGAVVGWIYDPKEPMGDNFVDFGIYEVCREKAMDFANGYERSFILDFNVVGDITDALATHQTL